eukprot:GGOE01031605.1.p1 GENE.GGOE01031605.1~~GGOE01031605.1.p1  ORF type:complete len:173 (+),score=3.49 GGOE01031605.1:666-1184(+)
MFPMRWSVASPTPSFVCAMYVVWLSHCFRNATGGEPPPYIWLPVVPPHPSLAFHPPRQPTAIPFTAPLWLPCLDPLCRTFPLGVVPAALLYLEVVFACPRTRLYAIGFAHPQFSPWAFLLTFFSERHSLFLVLGSSVTSIDPFHLFFLPFLNQPRTPKSLCPRGLSAASLAR